MRIFDEALVTCTRVNTHSRAAVLLITYIYSSECMCSAMISACPPFGIDEAKGSTRSCSNRQPGGCERDHNEQLIDV